ncbi:MAG TPA: amidohydrolase family protein [Rhodospirillales bacterium]|nr:amidohydrolase family protein [Rhodospirillales bacterium]
MRLFLYRWLVIFLVAAVPIIVSDTAEAKDPNVVLQKLDRDGDGQVSRGEWRKESDKFNKIDSNGDGNLSLKELVNFFDPSSGDASPVSAPAPAKAKRVKSPPPVTSTDAGPAADAEGWQGPIIDAHSQIDQKTNLETIVPMLNQAGVAQVILSTRFNQPSSDVIEFAALHLDRIIPAAKTKSKAFMKGRKAFPGIFHKELKKYDYRAMAEIIMWHAAKKGVGAGKAAMDPDDRRVSIMLDIARQKGIPFIAHVEFAGMGWDKSDYMEKLEAMVAANRDVPIAMIHMGQLGADDVGRLLPLHPNLYFITSHSNPVTTAKSKIPWTEMFYGSVLAERWQKLIVDNPDRFILAFDNVFYFQWEETFLPQVKVWRKALAALPNEVAHALAHGNAERLWKLPTAVRP